MFDRRAAGRTDDLTRDVVVVDDRDPGRVRWSAPSSGELGGYVGHVAGRDGFVIHPDPVGRYPAVPRATTVVWIEPDGGAGTALRGVNVRASAQGDEAVAFSGDGVVEIHDAAGSWRLDGDAWQLAFSGETLRAAMGREPVGCD